jgi:hypothetical protein
MLWFLFKGALSPGTSSVLRAFTPEERLQVLGLSIQMAVALFLTFGSARFTMLALREPKPSKAEEEEAK